MLTRNICYSYRWWLPKICMLDNKRVAETQGEFIKLKKNSQQQ